MAAARLQLVTSAKKVLFSTCVCLSVCLFVCGLDHSITIDYIIIYLLHFVTWLDFEQL